MNRANIIITNNCNLRCLHCYLDAKSKCENYKENYNIARDLIRKLHNDGINNIMFTGGECMTFPYLKELISFAKSLNMIVTIFTNGMIFNSEIFDIVDYVNLSIDGNKDTHNYIRQNKNSYDNMLNVLEYLKKIDKKTNVQMTINDLNVNQLEDIAKLGLNYLNIRNIKLILTSNLGRAKSNGIECNQKNIEVIMDKMEELYSISKYHIQFTTNIINEYDFDNYYQNKHMKFAIWFDIPKNEYFLYSPNFFKDAISNYKYEKIIQKNREIFNIIKNNSKTIKTHKYINLEEILDNMFEGERE